MEGGKEIEEAKRKGQRQRGVGGDERSVGTGNDRTETEGWRGGTFIRLSVCVSGNSSISILMRTK